jgi:hypothetical protein
VHDDVAIILAGGEGSLWSDLGEPARALAARARLVGEAVTA